MNFELVAGSSVSCAIVDVPDARHTRPKTTNERINLSILRAEICDFAPCFVFANQYAYKLSYVNK